MSTKNSCTKEAFLKCPLGVYTDFQEALEKAICSSHAGLEHLYILCENSKARSKKHNKTWYCY
jgi:hypothetical protein